MSNTNNPSSEKYLATVIMIGVVAVFLIIFGTFAKGCEQTEMTRRAQIELQMKQVDAGYEYERTQTNTTRVGAGTGVTTQEQTQEQAVK